jgi:predicted branched-subunit amino acid permease
MEHAQFKIETVKYAFVIWFWLMVGWLFIGVLGNSKRVKDSEIWAIGLMLILTFLPLLVKNLL